MIEQEKKIPLTEEEYNYLIGLLGYNKPIFKQSNYYFDTDDLFMNKNSITCRIRLKKGKYTGTMKFHSTAKNYSIEIDTQINPEINNNLFVPSSW